MGYKKIALIALFLIAHVMLFSSTHSEAQTLDQIKKEACPGGKVKMQKIVKNESRFIWEYPNETILLFPAAPGFSAQQLSTITQNTTGSNALDYAKESLRLIPPVARTKKFLRLYVDAIKTVKINHGVAKADESMVVEAFKVFEGCCLPLDLMMGKTVIPATYADLKALISNPDNYEDPTDLEQPDPNVQ